MPNKFGIFGEHHLSSLFDAIKLETRNKINAESEDYILNVNEEEYISCLEKEKAVDFPELDFENIYADDEERQISSDRFPSGFDLRGGSRMLPVQVIIIHIPILAGDRGLLRYGHAPGSFMWTDYVYINDDCLCFEIADFHRDAEKIKRATDEFLRKIKHNHLKQKESCEAFNSSLRDFIKITLDQAKQKHAKKQEFRVDLGIPFKKKANTAETFSVPSPKTREKIVVEKPKVDMNVGKPEPTLDEANYGKILKIVDDVGKNLEKLPSNYEGKDEETLRDYFLLVLQPNFEGGSATGETFNKAGKTDILLRHESSNVFVAECKFWRGEKTYLEAIDQLLSYLTWRDSKTCLLVFVQNADFSNVLNQIKSVTAKHSNYKKYVNNQTESWFNFVLHLNGDENREIKMAVMLYHLPE